jgi:nitronate monooxygenase
LFSFQRGFKGKQSIPTKLKLEVLLNQLTIPIIQGPMLGASTEAMAIAVSNCGGIGSYAVSNLGPQKIIEAAKSIRAKTDKPFALNLFIQDPPNPDLDQVKQAIQLLAPWRERFGLPAQALPNDWAEAFEPQFQALLECAPPVASFTFGILSKTQADALKLRGIFFIGTATTVGEAKAWANVGADAIVAQGFEAGGHRGTFLRDVSESQIGLVSLVSTMREAVEVPVIAAGGITDGKATAAMLSLGAAAVQIGTAYLLSEESSISQPWKAAIENVDDDATRLTRAFSGRYARGIENEFMREMNAHEPNIPPYPIQNALTQELRAAAGKAGSAEALSLWAGQSVALARRGNAREITESIWREAQDVLFKTTQRWSRERI